MLIVSRLSLLDVWQQHPNVGATPFHSTSGAGCAVSNCWYFPHLLSPAKPLFNKRLSAMTLTQRLSG